MFVGMMFFGWLPFLLLFLFIVAIRGILRALGIFRRRPFGRMENRSMHETFDPFGFEEFEPVVGNQSSLQSKIFRLASRQGGKVTVSDVVIETEMSVHEAESFMDRMVDGTHVRMEVSDEGQVFYEFPELLNRDNRNLSS
jgi:hypothetical protein